MMDDILRRRQDETEYDYHRRLIYGKLVDKTIDYDYAELAPYVYGKEYSADVARRLMYGSRYTLELLDDVKKCGTELFSDSKDDLDIRMIELQKMKQQFYDQRAAYNKMIRDRAREEELNDIIRECVSNGSMPTLDYLPPVGIQGDKTLLVSLNDIHYGANINNAWCRYNSAICAQMFENYLTRITEIADAQHCDECVVWAAGDAISGSIHRNIQVTNKENVIEQIMGVSELIAEFLAHLSRMFRTVRFYSVAGNHSRLESNKDNAIHGERLDNLVEWYLDARLQNFENVIITDEHKMDDTISMFDIHGKNYVMCHGDFDGSASKVQSLQTMVQQPVYAVLSGHLHHNQTNVVQGVRTVMAGSFQGMDDFCVEKRIYGKPEQMVCVCDDSGIVCYYDIDLS